MLTAILLRAARQLPWHAQRHARGCCQTANTVLGCYSNQQVVKHFIKEASVGTVVPKKAKGSQLLSQT